MSYSYLFKFLLLGDAEVGTTSLLLRYTERRPAPSQDYAPTVGIGFGAWITTLTFDSGETQVDVKLQIWDTPPGELFRSLVRPYYKETAAALLVYDVTRRETFEGISAWLAELKQLASPIVTCVLVGNKSDLEQERQVTTEEGATFAAKLGMLFFETSTRDVLPGHHGAQSSVDAAFESTAAKVFAKVQKGSLNPDLPEHGVKVGQSHPRRVSVPPARHAPLDEIARSATATPGSKPTTSTESAPAPAATGTKTTADHKIAPSSRQILDVDPGCLLPAGGAVALAAMTTQAIGRPRSLSEAERACIDDSFVSTVAQSVIQIDFQSSRVSQVSIPSTVNERGVVRYVLKCSTADGRRWGILKRFSEFVSLRKLLSKQSDYIAKLYFPPKSKFRGSKEQTVQDRMVALSTWITQVCSHTLQINATEAQMEMAVCMFLAEDGSCAPDSLAAITMEIEGGTVRNLSVVPDLQHDATHTRDASSRPLAEAGGSSGSSSTVGGVTCQARTPARGTGETGSSSSQSPQRSPGIGSSSPLSPRLSPGSRRRANLQPFHDTINESVEFTSLVREPGTTEQLLRGELTGSGRGTTALVAQSWWESGNSETCWAKPLGAALCDRLLFGRT